MPNAIDSKLLSAFAGLIPPLPPPPPPSEIDVLVDPSDEPDGAVLAELRRLYRGLNAIPVDDWMIQTAMGRLRFLYPQGTNSEAFSDGLVEVLRQIVEAVPMLRDCPKYTRSSPNHYSRVGGGDKMALGGYQPQHRSRFLRLFH